MVRTKSTQSIAAGQAEDVRHIGLRMQIVAAIISFSIAVGLVVAVIAANSVTSRNAEQRLTARTGTIAEGVSNISQLLLSANQRTGEVYLSGEFELLGELEKATQVMGYDASLLTDEQGVVLGATPSGQGLVGESVAQRYQHIALGIAGLPAISNVVPSAVLGVPVFALAAPFQSPDGLRVFSGAYDVGTNPFAQYDVLRTIYGTGVTYLVDGNGVIIASTRANVVPGSTLADVAAPLSAAKATHLNGTYQADGVQFTYRSAPVERTPWQVIVAVESHELVAAGTWLDERLQWILLGATIAAVIFVNAFIARNLTDRRRLRSQQLELDRLAKYDPLTNLLNRREGSRILAETLVEASRLEDQTSVCFIDVDYFKQINDTYGHNIGDQVLVQVATTLRSLAHDTDCVVRWGGEEFLVILPHTGLPAAMIRAEAMREAVATTAFRSNEGDEIQLTISIGVSISQVDDLDILISRADQAMYSAKTAGRNCVVLAESGSPASTESRF